MFSKNLQYFVAFAVLLCSSFIGGEAALLRRAKDLMTEVADEVDSEVRGLGYRYSDASMDKPYYYSSGDDTNGMSKGSKGGSKGKGSKGKGGSSKGGHGGKGSKGKGSSKGGKGSKGNGSKGKGGASKGGHGSKGSKGKGSKGKGGSSKGSKGGKGASRFDGDDYRSYHTSSRSY